MIPLSSSPNGKRLTVSTPPSLEKAPIRAKIGNIPFDLVTEEGLSYIARPLGQMVDAKPFSSINSADIKVIVDLTKPLPKELEIERDDGLLCIISFSYPWLPPLWPTCNTIGHKAAFCPQGVPVKVSQASVPHSDKGKNKFAVPPPRPASGMPVGKVYVPKASVKEAAEGSSLNQMVIGESSKSAVDSLPPAMVQVGVVVSDNCVEPEVLPGLASADEVTKIIEDQTSAVSLETGSVSGLGSKDSPVVPGTVVTRQSLGFAKEGLKVDSVHDEDSGVC